MGAEEEDGDNVKLKHSSSIGRHASRIGTACVGCRTSKVRCDGQRPTCQRCRKTQSTCLWNDVDRRRRRRTHSSVSDGLNDETTKREKEDEEGNGKAKRVRGDEPSPLNVLAEAAASGTTSNPSSRLAPPPSSQAPEPSPTPPPQRRTMWWEQLLDLSNFGLEAGPVSQDMLDTLAGRVAWIDGSELQGGGRSSSSGMSSTESDLDSAVKQKQRQIAAAQRRGEEEEEEEEPRTVRVQYFRLLGPTGISPGIKKVTVELRLTPGSRSRVLFDKPSSSSQQRGRVVEWERLLEENNLQQRPQLETPTETAPATPVGITEDEGVTQRDSSTTSDLFQGDLPSQAMLDELVPLFFDRLGDHYPCLDRDGFTARLAQRGAGLAMLVNVVCALAARYSNSPSLVVNNRLGEGISTAAHTYGRVFADKAKTFLATSLSVPSRATCLAFAMMAWHEFACNLDSAFWNYAGMSLRMAIDLGLHRRPSNASVVASSSNDITAAETGMIDDGLLFWTVYQMDRVLAMGTGRPMSIKDDEITCPMPDRSKQQQRAFDHHIVHVRIGGKVAEALNAVVVAGSEEEKGKHEAAGLTLLDRLEEELIQSYASMPEHLELNPRNFRNAPDKHVFLELHLWFHCLVFLLNRSPIVDRRRRFKKSGADITVDASFDMVRMAVAKCKDIVSLDEAHDGTLLICAPMANQTLFLAGCAELDELKRQSHQSSQQQSLLNDIGKQHLCRTARQGFHTFVSALERMSVFWDGIRWIHGVLIQRELGIDDDELVELAVGTDALVTRREMRLLQRLHASCSPSSFSPNTANVPSSSTMTTDQTSATQAAMLPSPLTFPPTLPSAQVSISQVESLTELESLFPQLFPAPIS